jgi:hypothetical protein
MLNRYFDFLCNIVGRRNEYEELLKQLHRTEFYSLVPNDHNRGADGEHLREIFCDMMRLSTPILFNKPCSVLEMLIGLAHRLEFESAQSSWEKSPEEWFWILLNNLGLDEYTNDEYFNDRDTLSRVDIILDIFLRRLYKRNGEGGLFPLRYPKENQRKVEIWYQMTAYILENYPI